jgi:alkylphosphonate utilization operon protein PhnA
VGFASVGLKAKTRPYEVIVFLMVEVNTMAIKDSNGTELVDGDSVQVIKDLKVKGTSVTLKRGTVIKNIRLNEDE